jgi:hypothetical protein
VVLLLAILVQRRSIADEPPVIPVGLDAYRHWDRWPLQRIGARAYMRSTYDRRGGNEGADASHFLYQLADDRNVTLDVEGPGILCFARYNHWHGSPWHYIVDGVDHLISETSTADPNHPVAGSTFLPAGLLPRPLAWTWADTRGADLSWVPIEFEKSFQMQYARTHYGTGYYIFQQFVPGSKLSHPIKAWDGKSPPDPHVLELFMTPASPSLLPQSLRVVGYNASPIPPRRTVTLINLDGPAMLRALTISLPRESALSAGDLRLWITWDGRAAPSVDVPLPIFFGAGTLYNRDDREYLVKAFPVSVRFDRKRITLTSIFPMPFFQSAKIELRNEGEQPVKDVVCVARTEPLHTPHNHVAYFHATYRDHPSPEKGKDLILLDTRGLENSRDWTGSFIGTSFIFSHNANLTTLEGDPRFYFDDSQSPQAQGTGTEEWGGGGDYWGGRNMTLPFAGHPCGAPSLKEAKSADDRIESAYRFLLGDLFPFGRNARVTLEHGGTNESTEHYESVTYWYGLPGASVIETDTLQIGDAASEKSHAYLSLDASPPQRIESRYEWGVDHLDGLEIYPAHTDTGRTTTGTSQFTMRIDPENWGVMLRRKLDDQFPNQRAEIFVADADVKGAEFKKGAELKKGAAFKPAGVWYTAGSNTCVYSNPKQELGATQHIVQTSNRRFRDDEFLIGRDLTRGRSRIRIRVKFTPVNTPLFPNHPLPPLAWSEVRYIAYSFVMPKVP